MDRAEGDGVSAGLRREGRKPAADGGMMDAVRVAYTLEQCWHAIPGGTGVAALEVARELVARSATSGIGLIGVAGSHATAPAEAWTPPVEVRYLSGSGPSLYARWLWANRPVVETATGPVDVVHATSIIPCPSRAPLVVTIHDLAFLHEPDHFSRWGTTVFRRSLKVIRRRGALVLCSSQATMDDCEHAGIGRDRLRLVPLGARVVEPTDSERDQARALVESRIGDGEYLVFVGTLEPRKNLARLIEAVAMAEPKLPLVVIGPSGWGETVAPVAGRVEFVGHLPEGVRNAVVASAAALCYPSLREGFGLPVVEGMALGTPVVTSRGTATEETAGGAAVLVEPTDVNDIARGISDALGRRAELRTLGLARAAQLTWANTARLTVDAYRDARSEGPR